MGCTLQVGMSTASTREHFWHSLGMLCTYIQLLVDHPRPRVHITIAHTSITRILCWVLFPTVFVSLPFTVRHYQGYITYYVGEPCTMISFCGESMKLQLWGWLPTIGLSQSRSSRLKLRTSGQRDTLSENTQQDTEPPIISPTDSEVLTDLYCSTISPARFQYPNPMVNHEFLPH
jgi:hypothetical protein